MSTLCLFLLTPLGTSSSFFPFVLESDLYTDAILLWWLVLGRIVRQPQTSPNFFCEARNLKGGPCTGMASLSGLVRSDFHFHSQPIRESQSRVLDMRKQIRAVIKDRSRVSRRLVFNNYLVSGFVSGISCSLRSRPRHQAPDCRVRGRSSDAEARRGEARLALGWPAVPQARLAILCFIQRAKNFRFQTFPSPTLALLAAVAVHTGAANSIAMAAPKRTLRGTRSAIAGSPAGSDSQRGLRRRHVQTYNEDTSEDDTDEGEEELPRPTKRPRRLASAKSMRESVGDISLLKNTAESLSIGASLSQDMR
jgi:hypothetical protein